MSRVAYGQKGYSGASMSANARAAYEAGEMPRSKWTKTAILGALRGYCDEMDLLYDPAVESETKAALFDRFIASSSWHHTGAYARETEFFALDEAAVVGAFRELGPEETAERDRIRAQAAARVREAERHRREAECLFEYRFSCSPYSAMAYEAFHPELCERRVSKHRKQELVVYRPAGRQRAVGLCGDVRPGGLCGQQPCGAVGFHIRHGRGSRVARYRLRRGRAEIRSGGEKGRGLSRGETEAHAGRGQARCDT